MHPAEAPPLTIARTILGPQRLEFDLRSASGQPAPSQNQISRSGLPLLLFGDPSSSTTVSSLLQSQSDSAKCAILVECSIEFSQTWALPSLRLSSPDKRYWLITSKNDQLLSEFAERLMASQRFFEILDGVKGEYETPVRNWFAEALKPGWRCIDVGSHIGILSCEMAKWVGPTGRVFSFDAFEQNASDVNFNAAFLGVADRVQARWFAVTDGTESSVSLFSGRHHWSAEWNLRGIDVEGKASETQITVPARSLDGLFPSEHIDFVKIDVEGAASGVIKGMRSLLTRCQPLLFIEFHGDSEVPGIEELRQRGYVLWDLVSRQPIVGNQFSYHMIASRPE